MPELWRWRVTIPPMPPTPWSYTTKPPLQLDQITRALPPGARVEVEEFERTGRTKLEG